MSGLAPIFKPIAKQKKGENFQPEEFAHMVEDIYGIKLHPWAAEDLAPRLEACGILTKINLLESGQAASYVYAEVEQSFDEVSEAAIRAVLRDFTEYATKMLSDHKITLSEQELEKVFLDHLVLTDFNSIRSRPQQLAAERKSERTLSLPKSKAVEDQENESAQLARLDVICASYILEAFTKNRDVYELLVKIASGALLAEVVLNVQSPSTGINLRALTVILDAPLVMSILDLRAPEATEYARAFANQLKSNGASLKIFNHSIDEIGYNLKSVVENVSNGGGHGATARRLRFEKNFRVYLTSIQQDIRSALDRFDIKPIESPSSAISLQELSKDEENEFGSMLGFYQNWQAQARDASSVAGTIRLRRKAHARLSSFQNALYIFVTENTRVADKSAKFAVTKKLIIENEVPPALSDRFLAGLLWVVFGGKTDELTHHRLLANCVAALEPRTDVTAKVQQFLSELDEQKAAHFRALMTDERAGQHLMQLTLGDALLVHTRDDASDLLIAIESQMEAKHRARFEESAAEIKAAADARIVEIEKEKAEEVAEAKSRLAQMERAGLQADMELQSLRDRQTEEQERRKQVEESAMNGKRALLSAAVKAAIRSAGRTRILIYLAFFALMIFIAIAPIFADTNKLKWMATLVAVITIIVTATGFWELPRILFERVVASRQSAVFNEKIAEYALQGHEDLFVIDWNSGEVVPK